MTRLVRKFFFCLSSLTRPSTLHPYVADDRELNYEQIWINEHLYFKLQNTTYIRHCSRRSRSWLPWRCVNCMLATQTDTHIYIHVTYVCKQLTTLVLQKYKSGPNYTRFSRLKIITARLANINCDLHNQILAKFTEQHTMFNVYQCSSFSHKLNWDVSMWKYLYPISCMCHMSSLCIAGRYRLIRQWYLAHKYIIVTVHKYYIQTTCWWRHWCCYASYGLIGWCIYCKYIILCPQ